MGEKKKEKLCCILFFVILYAMWIGDIISADRLYSEWEKRRLAQKPEFSYQAVVDGSYGEAYEKWLTDQFPERDYWVGIKNRCERLLGKKELKGIYIGKDGYLFSENVEIADWDKLERKMKERFGKEKVSRIYVPAAGAVLGEKLPNFVSFYGREDAVFAHLLAHKEEDIYYRTDHHWTMLGAYYAYDSFCKSKKIMPNKIEDYQDVSFGGFLGSFYNDTGKLKTLKEDTLYAYYPVSNDKLVLEYTNNDGNTLSGNVLEDASGYGKGVKYSAFIDGDNPYTFIRNRSLADGSSCIIVKESFGNAIIPFLADHYQRIYVIDYRYWDGSLISFAKEKSVDDVIIINNISMTRNSYQVGKMALLVED